MKDFTKSACVTNRANVPAKNKKSPIVPGKLLPTSRVLWRSAKIEDDLKKVDNLNLVLNFSPYKISFQALQKGSNVIVQQIFG